MTNMDFAKLVAKHSGCTQTAVKEVLAGLPGALLEVVSAQDDIVLGKAVRISGVWKEAHEARNPHTNGTVSVPAKVVAKAKIMPSFKRSVAEGVTLDDAE